MDTGANLSTTNTTALNQAINIISSDSTTYAQAKIINDATNSGYTTYSISDTAANIAGGTITDVSAISNSQVSAADTYAVISEADKIANISKVVIYSVRDTAANLTSLASTNANGLNKAVNLISTDSCTYAQAKVIEDATNSGYEKYDISDTAANLVAGVSTDSVSITNGQTVSAFTYATAAEASN